MTTTKKKRSARDKRIMVAAVIVAGAIVAGSTFAWFTSKDEVTNRLSASADYNVAIAEDFQPPENWVPGQEINKDVSAVNTGNVDAFVRMWLEGEMSVMKKNSLAGSTAVPSSDEVGLGFTATTDGDSMKALGFLYKDNSNYYKVLSTVQRQNPNDPDDSNTTNTNNQPAYFSEVQSVQAGGYLVSAPASAKWTYTTEQEETIKLANGTTEVIPAGTTVGTAGATGATKIVNNAPCNIDSDTFVPQTKGLYIFRRNIDVNGSANTADSYEYSGYVFDGTNYFALYTDTEGKSDYSLPSNAVTVETATSPEAEPLTYTLNNDYIKLYTASETVVENSGLTWSYTAATTTEPAKLTATYPGADGVFGDDNTTAAVDESLDDISIDVTLANIGTTDQTWTAKTATGKTTTFYYNDDLEEGDTTTKLVDSVTLSSATTQHAFLAFDFDLNVFLESVQVTMGDDGKEMTTPVESGGAFATAPAGGVGAFATPQNKNEIEDIVWN